LRSVVLAGDKSQPDIVVLLSLLKACSLLNLVFTRDERKSAGKRVDALVKGEVFGDVVAKTIEEIETAAAAATMAAIAG
jgi:Trp operon repressor